MRLRTNFVRVGVMLAIVVMVAACSSDGSTDSTSPGGSSGDVVDVTIENFMFVDSTASVSVGDTVRWTNNQSVSHTVTSGEELWDTTLSNGGTFEFTFDDAGTYPYFCAIHPSMTGTVEVSG